VSALALLLCLGAQADLAARVQGLLDDAEVRSGTFEQRKQVKGFKRPLTSSGTYTVTRGRGVRWTTRAPFQSELTVTSSDITSTQDGVQVYHLDARTEPGVRVVTELLLALLGGDLRGLDRSFAVEGEVSAGRWALELTPRVEALRRRFERISLAGDRAVRTVRLREVGGDETTIRLAPAAPDGGGPR
jgi:hypothetical protein